MKIKINLDHMCPSDLCGLIQVLNYAAEYAEGGSCPENAQYFNDLSAQTIDYLLDLAGPEWVTNPVTTAEYLGKLQ